ncbi:sigma-54-dependent sensor transcriptional response regulator, PAS domain-containing [Syntrophotalea carbinolica DSM 2380]|uniref:Sigma-54-dependent sensor transcriptional response regulator, PAS domain-containing n=1 Tax=Syntrophotalea carbinolica (strain DSM 2380 / NBRC 103641 / GraBd1) TaxID=338963 RepID=Q3A203_SYNC1|nr:sigma-54 dependent transcriptional regulator [Syntrophotalea carbinolica]ABA89604.1 sigma-54-dependent sensor transcriptional response regulator, PAS domain-containing [Syntrophotalea carbinolica DSM 2380]
MTRNADSPARILVIDDEKCLRFSFERFLAAEGYDVSTAAEFDEAVSLLRQGEYDLVFSDIVLGGRTGLEVLRSLREYDQSTPVVMITGFPNVDTAAEAVRLGAYDYISKPVVKKDLLQVARSALKYKQAIDREANTRTNLAAIFESVKDGLLSVDASGCVTDFNQAASRLCGWSKDDRGEKIDALSMPCAGTCRDLLTRTLEEGKSMELKRMECEHLERAGQVVSLSTSPLQNKEGDVFGAVMVVRDETRLDDLERSLNKRQSFHRMIATSSKMQQVFGLIETLAQVPSTVLILGESGTGKELVAEALHLSGPRKNRPLVKVNCAALSDTLLESELFGHVKGSFTGAVKDHVGRFQKADGGTIFLDEIGDISPRMQLRLLRVLQEKEVERIGDSTPVKVDVRIVAATNQDLEEKVRSGEFRQDLYYRLKVITLALPPLRERKEDIPPMVDHFIQRYNEVLGRNLQGVDQEVMRAMQAYDWPGNVRQLEHAIEHILIHCTEPLASLAHVPEEILQGEQAVGKYCADSEEQEQQQILAALDKTDWNKAKAARLLGIDRKTLYRKIEKFGLVEPFAQV